MTLVAAGTTFVGVGEDGLFFLGTPPDISHGDSIGVGTALLLGGIIILFCIIFSFLCELFADVVECTSL